MPERWSSPMLHSLQATAYLVIILWGIRSASHLIVLVLLGMLLAFCFLPFPEWLMHRFRIGKNAAIGLTVAVMGTMSAVLVFSLYERIVSFRAELPAYHQHFMALYQSVQGFLNAHGINLASISSSKLSTSDGILKLSQTVVPDAAGFLGDAILISVLSLIFLSAMVERPGGRRGALGERLRYYSGDVQRYIGISAQTGVIAALVNLALFLALGVEFPVVWAVLSFFLRFIPSLGFIMALVPPTLLTLLMSGWKRALLLAGGLILINLVVDYVLTPIFMKKEANVSFSELTLSLLLWGWLLGLAGGVLAIPLTMALKKFIDKQSRGGELASAPSQ